MLRVCPVSRHIFCNTLFCVDLHCFFGARFAFAPTCSPGLSLPCTTLENPDSEPKPGTAEQQRDERHYRGLVHPAARREPDESSRGVEGAPDFPFKRSVVSCALFSSLARAARSTYSVCLTFDPVLCTELPA